MTEADHGYHVARPYTRTARRETSPAWLRAVQRLRGFASLDLDRPFRCLDLGCGAGFQLTACAAAHPGAEFLGVDMNAAQIDEARSLAAAAGLRNIDFLEERFDALARDPSRLGAVDVVVLHGVWTWVPPEVRRDLVAILDAVLVEGGLAVATYNAMPGWASAEPLRRLVRAFAAGRSGIEAEGAIGDALGFLETLKEDPSGPMREAADLRAWAERMDGRPMRYLSHEWLPEAAGAAWHADVAAELASAGLGYLGSGRLGWNFDGLTLREAARRRVAAAASPELAETMRDVASNRSFRMDVFAKGGRRLPPAEAQADFGSLPVAIAAPQPDAPGAGGVFDAPGSHHAAAEAALAAADALGPAECDAVAAKAAAMAGAALRKARRAITVLLAQERLIPLATASPSSAALDACARFNAATLGRRIPVPAFASAHAGGALAPPPGVLASRGPTASTDDPPTDPETARRAAAAFLRLMPGGELPRTS